MIATDRVCQPAPVTFSVVRVRTTPFHERTSAANEGELLGQARATAAASPMVRNDAIRDGV